MHFLTVSAPIRNHWSENNTEPHTENIAFDQNQVDFSTVVSKEDVVDQTPGNSQPSSNVPEDFTPQTEPANARGRSGSLRRADFTISPVGPEEATALTSQGVTSGAFVLRMFLSLLCVQSWKTTFLPISLMLHPGLGWIRPVPWAPSVARCGSLSYKSRLH